MNETTLYQKVKIKHGEEWPNGTIAITPNDEGIPEVAVKLLNNKWHNRFVELADKHVAGWVTFVEVEK